MIACSSWETEKKERKSQFKTHTYTQLMKGSTGHQEGEACCMPTWNSPTAHRRLGRERAKLILSLITKPHACPYDVSAHVWIFRSTFLLLLLLPPLFSRSCPASKTSFLILHFLTSKTSRYFCSLPGSVISTFTSSFISLSLFLPTSMIKRIFLEGIECQSVVVLNLAVDKSGILWPES